MTAGMLETGLLFLSDNDTTLLKETPVSHMAPTPVSWLSPMAMLIDLRDFLLIMISDNLFMARIASTHRAHFLLAWNCFSFPLN